MSLVNEPIHAQAQESRKKYCRFKKSGIKYIDYKDPNFLMKFLNVSNAPCLEIWDLRQ